MNFLKNLYFQLVSSQLFPIPEAVCFEDVHESEAMKMAELAHEAYHLQDYKKARDIYTQAIETYPEQPFFYACRSLINELLEDGEGAFYDYQVAKKLDFNYHIFLEWVENGTAELGSKKTFTKETDVVEMGLEQVQNFNYAGAVVTYSKGLEVYPNHTDIYIFRGAVYMRMLKYREALDDFNKALSIEEASYKALLSRAKLYAAIRCNEEAAADFDQAVHLAPMESVVYEERADFLLGQEKYEEARKDYDKLVDLLPEDFYVYSLRADLLEKLELWQAALKDYDKAIGLNPYYSDLYMYRADVKEQLGDLVGAAQDRKLGEEMDED
ncbi:tetratricopeptide repeat protein [Sphingobacterium sp. UT-1RO-CII-1]|uniref:tetratricopeptide repeat protein n=1 Tax=Sphingobacterium sp. UT-1RO-CII-1 TaxID=2995225 RepID=UPI00227B741F|nr:tetratricopeptide repeat protein [Sphingobacterium sp. UT-1RO-CII-1]MCY4779217.1 tetratricopeptide repeat protein [Sphingobacterium sp. UT-1RO-CII-1]